MLKPTLTSSINHYVRILIIISVFVAPYFVEYWWKFLPASIIILSISNSSLYGVKASIKHITIAICLTLVFFIVFRFTILHNIRLHNIKYVPHLYSKVWIVTIFFQVLNEEMILRSLLLQQLRQKLQSTLLIILLPAILFSLFHYLFYCSQGYQLNLYALMFIGTFGILANTLFIRFEHIWFNYAIHFAWNATRFNGNFLKNGVTLSEGESFNYIEGSKNIFVLFTIITVLVIMGIYRIKFFRRIHAG